MIPQWWDTFLAMTTWGHGHINYDEESTNWFHKADIPAVKLVGCSAAVHMQLLMGPLLWIFSAEVVGGGMVETFALGGDAPYEGQSGGYPDPENWML